MSCREQGFEKFLFKTAPNGDDRARTDNLRVANAALSQLSYVPGPASQQSQIKLPARLRP
jgi:hypothetical protein